MALIPRVGIKTLLLLGSGAGAMYLLDPKSGKERRDRLERDILSLKEASSTIRADIESSVEKLKSPEYRLGDAIEDIEEKWSATDTDSKQLLSTLGLSYLGLRAVSILGLPAAILAALGAAAFTQNDSTEPIAKSKSSSKKKSSTSDRVRDIQAA